MINIDLASFVVMRCDDAHDDVGRNVPPVLTNDFVRNE